MRQKRFWCWFLIVALGVGLAMPARAAKPETVLIVVAATTLAATIAIVVTVASVHHRHKKIAVTGCIISGKNGMIVTDEEDRKIYALSGNMTDTKQGDRMSLLGKSVKPKGTKTRVWEVKGVIKDFGVCQL